ncbi:MAG: sugar ABC transporter permease [Clostridia bacterium]|nr:sugar ABC transporter permease [Clostridia bacterium]
MRNHAIGKSVTKAGAGWEAWRIIKHGWISRGGVCLTASREFSRPKKGTLAYTRAVSTRKAATVFLLPALLLIAIFIVYPIFDTFVISGYKWNGIAKERTFVGLDNWNKLLHDSDFWHAFRNNLTVMVFSILLQLPIGFLLATFLDAGGRKMNVFKTVWFFPYLMSSTAIAFLFSYALATNGGLISSFASMVTGQKIRIDLLGRSPHALFTVIGVMAWQFTPFYMVYFIAGYAGIDTSLYEASIIDGCTRSMYIRHIALPLLRPTIKAGMTMSLIGSLKYFDLIWNLTKGGPGVTTELMATYMYKQSFSNFNMGYGSCVAAGMFILITLIALFFQRVTNLRRDDA